MTPGTFQEVFPALLQRKDIDQGVRRAVCFDFLDQLFAFFAGSQEVSEEEIVVRFVLFKEEQFGMLDQAP